MTRILIISHGHPALSAGGGEQAAYTLFKSLRDQPDISPTFVARVLPDQLGHSGFFARFRRQTDEILWAPPPIDQFSLMSEDYDNLRLQVRELIEHIQPDIIHVQHFFHYGADLLTAIKDVSDIPTVMTLHEYMAICNNGGRMVKTDMSLCYREIPADCSNCYSDVSAGKFFLRKKRLLSAFEAVDHFISPSEFLKSRYVDWGVNQDIIEVIENLVAIEVQRPLKKRNLGHRLEQNNNKLTFGYFGQISRYKGTSVLFDAIKRLPQDVRANCKFILFGGNLHYETDDYRSSFSQIASTLSDCMSVHGPYRNTDVFELMASVDWVLLPSIWWENAPVVIQEAMASGRPVLCSDIGGMAEKIIPGVNGEHFTACSDFDLSNKISRITRDKLRPKPQRLDVASVNSERLNAHISIYGQVRKTYEMSMNASLAGKSSYG